MSQYADNFKKFVQCLSLELTYRYGVCVNALTNVALLLLYQQWIKIMGD